MKPKPDWQTFPCRCKKCGHDWDDWIPVGVPVATWLAHVRTLHCPLCGARFKSVLIRTTAGVTP